MVTERSCTLTPSLAFYRLWHTHLLFVLNVFENVNVHARCLCIDQGHRERITKTQRLQPKLSESSFGEASRIIVSRMRVEEKL